MSKEKIICWRGSDGDVQPIKCVCNDKFGYPNYCKDENGKEEKMFENTHFLKKEDAWISIVESIKSCVSLNDSWVKRVMEQLEEAQDELSKSVLEYHKVKVNTDNPFSGDM
jgi:hypothetical protein